MSDDRRNHPVDFPQTWDQQVVKKLVDRKIFTLGQLWQCVGRRPNRGRGIAVVARFAGVDRDKLLGLLTQQAGTEADHGIAPWYVQHVSGLLSVVLVAVATLAALLVCNASIVILPILPASQVKKILVTTHNLSAGQALRPEGVRIGWALASSDAISATDSFEGLVSAQSVRQGDPIRAADVMRLQVVAAADILSGTVIPTQAISLTWSAFNINAATQVTTVVGHKASQNIKAGQVILINLVGSSAALCDQVVVVGTTTGLPAFHVITSTDVTLAATPLDPEAFVAIADVLGRYTLEPVTAGIVLSSSQLSSIRLQPDVVAGRFIVSLPIEPGALSPAVGPGAHATLVFSLSEDADKTLLKRDVDDVIILAVNRSSTGSSLVVAVREDLRTILVLLLGRPMFLLLPSH